MGQSGFFKPRFPPPFLSLFAGDTATSFYDTAPLRDTLKRLVDAALFTILMLQVFPDALLATPMFIIFKSLAMLNTFAAVIGGPIGTAGLPGRNPIFSTSCCCAGSLMNVSNTFAASFCFWLTQGASRTKYGLSEKRVPSFG